MVTVQYEDFTSIDWLRDGQKERVRRENVRKNATTLRRRLANLFDAASAWFLVLLIGLSTV